MRLTFASYNIHKAVGTDRRRNPERILAVLHELGADIVALQEADRRIGERPSVLPREALEDAHWQIAPVARRPRSIGWHGNAILVRRGLELGACEAIDIPTIEPRGAACARIRVDGRTVRVIGTHLDLSGLRRRDQIRALLRFSGQDAETCPTVIMGDFNHWGRASGAMREFAGDWTLITPGKSYPSRQPVAHLDRIAVSSEFACHRAAVHHSPLAAVASDHLPVLADLELPKK